MAKNYVTVSELSFFNGVDMDVKPCYLILLAFETVYDSFKNPKHEISNPK